MHIQGLEFVVVALALFLGAMLQGSLGFGMTMFAFPALILVEPALLPQTILIVSVPMVLSVAYRNRGAANWREVAWITSGRVPGLVLAVFILGVASKNAVAIGAGAVVLLAVALSLWAPALPRTRFNLFVTGTIASLFGTAVSIGGPPLGLLYQHEEGRRLRSTISLLMLFGAPLSLVFLAATGNVSSTDVRTGVALIPAGVIGSYCARWLIPWTDKRLRPIVLTICAVAAMLALARVALTPT